MTQPQTITLPGRFGLPRTWKEGDYLLLKRRVVGKVEYFPHYGIGRIESVEEGGAAVTVAAFIDEETDETLPVTIPVRDILATRESLGPRPSLYQRLARMAW